MAVKVLSLNVWGLHYLAKRVRERICCIGEELKTYDIVGLQELWSEDDYLFLKKKLKQFLPYSCHLKSGVIGSGLCIFSRHPIMSVHGQQFTVTGALREIKDGEVFAGKGILMCRIMTPKGPLLFVNTHINPRCRESQMYEVTKLIENARRDDMVILCGDFNTGDNHPAYRLITTFLGLKDAFAGCNVNTCNLQSNIYTKRVNPTRIDFIFYSSDFCLNIEMEVQSKRVSLSGNIPGRDFPYSDHEGIEVVFALNERTHPLPPPSLLLDDNAVSALDEIAQRIQKRKRKFEAARPHRRAITIAGVLFVSILILSLLLGNSTVMKFLAAHSLGYFVIAGVGLLGACLGLSWLIPVFNIHHVNGMETQIGEIQTRLSYNRTLVESSTTNYQLLT